MSKAERSFDLFKGIRSLFGKGSEKVLRRGSDHVDPALLSFARLGLLAYYVNPL